MSASAQANTTDDNNNHCQDGHQKPINGRFSIAMFGCQGAVTSVCLVTRTALSGMSRVYT